MLGSQWQALLGGGNAVKWRFFLRKRPAVGLVVVKSPRRVGMASFLVALLAALHVPFIRLATLRGVVELHPVGDGDGGAGTAVGTGFKTRSVLSRACTERSAGVASVPPACL